MDSARDSTADFGGGFGDGSGGFRRRIRWRIRRRIPGGFFWATLLTRNVRKVQPTAPREKVVFAFIFGDSEYEN